MYVWHRDLGQLRSSQAKPIHFGTSGLCCGLALVNFAVKIALVFTVHLAKGALRACLKVLQAESCRLPPVDFPQCLPFSNGYLPLSLSLCHRQLLNIFTCSLQRMPDCICPLVPANWHHPSARTNQDSHLMPQSMLLEIV